MSKIFGERLKELRIEHGYTQQNIADIFNVSKMTISSWEKSKQEPCIDDIIRLTLLFKTSSDYLLGIEDESGRKTIINNNFNNNSKQTDFKI